MIMAIMTGSPNVFVLLFAGQSRYYKVLFGVDFGVFKIARILIAVKGKLVYHLEDPIALSKLLHIAKKAEAMLFFCNIASVSLYFGFSVPTTPIHLFTCYTTPICKAPFRENVPKLV